MDTLAQLRESPARPEPTRKELIQALRWYASRDNWLEYLDGQGFKMHNCTPVTEDRGARARAILKRVRK